MISKLIRFLNNRYPKQMNQARENLSVASPSETFRKLGLNMYFGFRIGDQKATLETIHQLPYSPILSLRSDYEGLSQTPSEGWEEWND